MKKLNEIFKAAVKKYDDETEERFNRYLDDLVGKLNDLTKFRDNLKSYLFENSDKFEYDPKNKTIIFKPGHRFVGTGDTVLSSIVLTVFGSDGIIRYMEGSGFSCCEEIDKRLKKEYQSRHPDWFHLEGDAIAIFKYPDDGMNVKLVVHCLDVNEIIMEQI